MERAFSTRTEGEQLLSVPTDRGVRKGDKGIFCFKMISCLGSDVSQNIQRASRIQRPAQKQVMKAPAANGSSLAFLPAGEPPHLSYSIKGSFARVRVFPALWLSLPLLPGGWSGLLWTNQISPRPQLQEVSRGFRVSDTQATAAAAAEAARGLG